MAVFGSDNLDVPENIHLDCLVAVRVVQLFCPFGQLEGGVLCTLLFILGDSTEAAGSCDLSL